MKIRAPGPVKNRKYLLKFFLWKEFNLIYAIYDVNMAKTSTVRYESWLFFFLQHLLVLFQRINLYSLKMSLENTAIKDIPIDRKRVLYKSFKVAQSFRSLRQRGSRLTATKNELTYFSNQRCLFHFMSGPDRLKGSEVHDLIIINSFISTSENI